MGRRGAVSYASAFEAFHPRQVSFSFSTCFVRACTPVVAATPQRLREATRQFRGMCMSPGLALPWRGAAGSTWQGLLQIALAMALVATFSVVSAPLPSVATRAASMTRVHTRW